MFPVSDESRLVVSPVAHYVRLLRRGWWLVVVCMVVSVGLAVVYTARQTRVYESSARILLTELRRSDTVSVERVEGTDRLVQNQIELLLSDPVGKVVKRKIADPASVAAHGESGADVIRVTASGASPANVAATANAYADAFIQLETRSDVARSAATAEVLTRNLADVNTKLGFLDGALAETDRQIAAAESPEVRQSLVEQRSNALANQQNLRNELNSSQAYYTRQLAELDLNGTVAGGSGAQLLDRATAPLDPSSPSLRRNVLLAAALGVLLGIGLLLLRDYLDDSITSREELEEEVGGLPVLGVIPFADAKDLDPLAPVDADPMVREALRTLRTSVTFSTFDQGVRVISVTSPMAGEGKSTIVANLATLLAAANESVLIVCCDLRRPRVQRFFDEPIDPGLTSMIIGKCAKDEVIRHLRVPGRVDLITAGIVPPNPSELLMLGRTKALIAEVGAGYDWVILDSPPVLPVADAMVIARLADATLLITNAATTTRRQLKRTLKQLDQVETVILGVVLNGASNRHDDTYGPYYGPRPQPQPHTHGPLPT